ncbi:MAG: hypothetical protein D6B25_02800 [Desulfobulbaceae bacterium]|nr:MAG: hypothetical protein D6B25_02800 [Desulfobulbaceae bacterium]
MELNDQLLRDIRFNCDITDAKDHGIYSMCTMVLKLRNHYKWEHQVEPWSEPEPADLLDWIEKKENYWEEIQQASLKNLRLHDQSIEPFNVELVNELLDDSTLYYGAGYGRSMKSIFFLAEVLQQRSVADLPVMILGKELIREMASPFAMLQNNQIIIRKEPFRYFLWDQIQEMRSSSRSSIQQFMSAYDLLKDGTLNQQQLKQKLDLIVEQELEMIIRHEVGEYKQNALRSNTVKKLIARFPGSRIEYICRGIKDVLADTCPEGLLAFIIKEQKLSSLGLFLGFLDGVREVLLKEIVNYGKQQWHLPDWQKFGQAREHCWQRLEHVATHLNELAEEMEKLSDPTVSEQFEQRIAAPLGFT